MSQCKMILLLLLLLLLKTLVRQNRKVCHKYINSQQKHFNTYDVLYSQRCCVVCLRYGTLVGTQPINHTVNTSPRLWIKTRHITASVITPHKLNNLNCQDFNDYPFLTYIFNQNYNFNCYGVMATQLTTTVRL